MKKYNIILILMSILIACSSCSKEEIVANTDGNPKSSQMKAICELATMECYYHNVAKYFEKDTSGALFWKKDKEFWIEYSGIVTIGIDASKLQMQIEEDVVTISIPEAKVLSSKVAPESLTKDSFYVAKDSDDINVDDETKAYDEAEKNMTEKASSDTTLLSNAQQRAQSLLEDYVNNIGEVVGKEYKINWIYLEDEENDNKEIIDE